MQENKWYKSVKLQLSCLSTREELMITMDKCRLIGNRITQGWAFLGISKEQHNRDMIEIKEEVCNQLGFELKKEN